MLELTVAINDDEIARIGVHNTGNRDVRGRTRYNVYDLREEPDTLVDAEYIGYVYHNRTEGASVLVERVSSFLADPNDTPIAYDQRHSNRNA